MLLWIHDTRCEAKLISTKFLMLGDDLSVWYFLSSMTFPWLLMIFQSSMTFHGFSRKFYFSRSSRPCVNLIYDVTVCGVHFTNDFLLQFKYDGTVVFFPVIQLLTTIVCTYHVSTVANHCFRIEVSASVYSYLLNLNRNWKKVSETGPWYNWKNKLKQCYRLWSPAITR